MLEGARREATDGVGVRRVQLLKSRTSLGNEDVGESLGTLERAGFITTTPTTSLPGQREMAFHHGLMRDVAYQSISTRRLTPIHASVVERHEALASDRRDEFIETAEAAMRTMMDQQ
jgi:hypothetical protein